MTRIARKVASLALVLVAMVLCLMTTLPMAILSWALWKLRRGVLTLESLGLLLERAILQLSLRIDPPRIDPPKGPRVDIPDHTNCRCRPPKLP